MSRLRNRTRQIPGGFQMYIPATKFKARPFSSFETIVGALMSHFAANPALAKQNGWPTDRAGVEELVDSYNAAICERMGWTDYIMLPSLSAPSPKFKALSPINAQEIAAVAGRVKQIWSGVKIIHDWEESGYPLVEQAKAESRAATCADCPMNGKGDFTRWFTVPAASAIKRQVERFEQRNLSTVNDEKLGVCNGCLCPLRTKVFCPIDFIRPHTGEETLKALRDGKNCWIISELGE